MASTTAPPAILFALLLGLGLGMNQLGGDSRFVPGLDVATRWILRIGVACLGARIGLSQVHALGPTTLVLVLLAVPVTLLASLVLGHLLRLSPLHSLVAGTAVAVCGASAALAIAAVLPRGRLAEQNVVCIVIGVTALATAAMVIYPPLADALGFEGTRAGIFLGGTIHDVAQAAGAGYLVSPTTGDAATVTKLLRVVMLIPIVTVLAWRFRQQATGSVPLFLIGFAGLVLLNSAGLLSAPLRGVLDTVSLWCLLITMAALGMKTSFADLSGLGWRPVAQLLLATCLLASLVGAALRMTGS